MYKLTTLSILTALFFCSGCGSGRNLFKQGGFPIISTQKQAQFDVIIPTSKLSELLFVNVEIGTKFYKFLFDTGAPMVISQELQKEFQFQHKERGKVSDSQKRSNIQNYVQLDSLRLSGVLFTNLVAIEADLRYSPILACLGIDGIIGANLMRHAFWEMDAASGFLRMSSAPKEWPLENPRLVSKPFRAKRTYTPVVDMRVENTLYRNITFDTGSGDLLSLGKKAMMILIVTVWLFVLTAI
jgi:hypothetical protein